MKTCTYLTFDADGCLYCENPCEGNTEFCGTHNRQIRKEQAEVLKQSQKRNTLIAKQRAKNQVPRAKISKVSEKQKDLNEEYLNLRAEHLKTHTECEATVSPTCGKFPQILTIHHKKGRGKYLLDTTTWLVCCMSCHVYIESHPKEAKERGWSESRLATIKQTI